MPSSLSKEQPREHRTLPIIDPLRRRRAGRDRGTGLGRLRILLVVIALGGPPGHDACRDFTEPDGDDGQLEKHIDHDVVLGTRDQRW
jgi:hypothetical protein